MPAPTILVIGCGPGGMSFCHAMETKKQEMMSAGEDISVLPTVTAMERSPGPGGVWRSSRTNGANNGAEEKKDERAKQEETTNMYEGLWTNGPKESIEFFDYSYDAHFGHALPVYMPRAALLEYMLARVTRKCSDFFEKYARFNMEVQSVVWNAEVRKFDVTSKNTLTGNCVREFYDKCIWGAGDNGKRKIPHSMVTMFREGGFSGRIIHSSDTANFEDDVKGKRILMIGGAFSAEDLALTAIKMGAEKIYISTRTEENVVTWTSAWPGNKVKVLVEMQPIKVTDNGKCIQFAEVDKRHGDIFCAYDEIEMKIRNIDTVILCTGYESNLSMLSEELRKPFEIEHKPLSYTLDIPENWKMDETGLPGHLCGIKPGTCIWFKSHVYYPDLYKWTLIDNPNMMYLFGEDSDHPILAVDAIAWLFVDICTGRFSLPPPVEQRRLNKEQALKEMATYPMIRFEMDSNFYNHVVSTWEQLPEDEQTELWSSYYDDMARYDRRIYAQVMRDGRYPLDIGTIDVLNDTGEQLFRMDSLSYEHRRTLDKKDKDTRKWRTFRDIQDASEFRSVFTGTMAVPLKKKWIEIDDIKDIDILKPL